MNKKELLEKLDSTEKFLIRINRNFSRSKIKFITKKAVQTEIQMNLTKWFEEVEPLFQHFGIEKTIITKYHDLFTRLLTLTTKTSWKTTYQKTISEILADFKCDLTVVLMKSASKITSVANLAKILENVTKEEKEYLDEALGCARYKFFRGSMVLVWSAAIHRMHKTVERLGFNHFNQKSREMKDIDCGRFKRFNKSFTIHSLSELRASVFDNDLLWILEYWELIDANQHQRLSICFTMRNNAAHPGDAPIKEINLASAFSDLKEIIFDNPKFGI